MTPPTLLPGLLRGIRGRAFSHGGGSSDPERVLSEGIQIRHQVRQLFRHNVHDFLFHCYICGMQTKMNIHDDKHTQGF